MVSKITNPSFRDSGACYNELPIATATRLGIALLLLWNEINQNIASLPSARDRSSCDMHPLVMMMMMIEVRSNKEPTRSLSVLIDELGIRHACRSEPKQPPPHPHARERLYS